MRGNVTRQESRIRYYSNHLVTSMLLLLPAATLSQHTAFAMDIDEDGLDDAIEQSLINQYRPFLFFDSGEGLSDGYWPASVTWHVQHSELKHGDNTIYTKDELINNPLLIL